MLHSATHGTSVSAAAMQSPRMPPWEGPFKLMIKVLSATVHSTDMNSTKRLRPLVEFQRAGSTYLRKVRGPLPVDCREKELAGKIECEPVWNWSMDLYYGGEVINHNRQGNDTIKIHLESHI